MQNITTLKILRNRIVIITVLQQRRRIKVLISTNYIRFNFTGGMAGGENDLFLLEYFEEIWYTSNRHCVKRAKLATIEVSIMYDGIYY